jgi:DNA polymerase-1
MFRLVLVDATNRVNVMSRSPKVDDPVRSFLNEVERTAKICGNATPILCWDHPDASEYRRKIYPSYKGQREKVASVDLHVRESVLASRGNYCCWWDANYEADDLIATAAKFAGDLPLVIHSQDGDMSPLLMNPARLQITTSTSDREKIKWVSRSTVEQKLGIRLEQFIEYRALVGDSSDNLPGVVGIGAMNALSILQQFNTVAEAVQAGEALTIRKDKREILQQAYELGEFAVAVELATLRDDAVVPTHIAEAISAAANRRPDVRLAVSPPW